MWTQSFSWKRILSDKIPANKKEIKINNSGMENSDEEIHGELGSWNIEIRLTGEGSMISEQNKYFKHWQCKNKASNKIGRWGNKEWQS